MAGLSCGIVGLPNVGKSTLFNALTLCRAPASNYPFCTIDPNIGVVEVFDPRLKVLAELSKSEKIVYATMEFVDIAGLVEGASEGAGLGNAFLSHIRDTDAIVQVVRCFLGEVIHVRGQVDPVADIEIVNLELILSDLNTCENNISKLERQAKIKKEAADALVVLKKAQVHLHDERPLRTLSLTDEERRIVDTYRFLTMKKVLYVCNISEEDLLSSDNKFVKAVEQKAAQEGALVLSLCASLECEIAQLDPEDRPDFLASAGLHESGLTRLSKAAFDMLGLMTFLTTGEMESRAWTITKGSTAYEAAGKIHTDIQQGFVRAEVIPYEDYVHYKGRQGAKEAGKMRAEGRDYIVQDGDVLLFLHSN